MTYTAATKLPTLAELTYFQWSTPDDPNPSLAAPLKPTDTTAYFSSPPYDETGTIITGGFLMGVRNEDSYVMTCYVAPAAVAADGLSATVVQGVRLTGLDFTTSNTDLIPTDGFDEGDAICCNITAVMQNIIVSVLQGDLATGGTGLVIGTEPGAAGETTTIYRTTTAGVKKGFVRWSSTEVQYSEDGTTWINISDVTASDLVKVSANDTTPGYLNGKITAGTGITLTENNDGGDEDLEISVNGALADLISDVTATATEINTALAGISVNVTQANLDTLTDGETSDADALHTHPKLGGAISLTAGEAIDGSSTPQYLCQASEDQISTITIHNANTTSTVFDLDWNDMSDTSFGHQDSGNRLAQSFTFTDGAATTIKLENIRIFLQKVVAPTDNVTIEIMGDDSDKPDGSVITNGTSGVVTGASLSTSYKWTQFTWSTPPTLTSGSKYWATIKRSGITDGVNYYQFGKYAASKYAGHGSSSYTLHTTTWSAESVNDFAMQIQATMDFGNKVLKLDANDLTRGLNYVGTTEDNVAADATITVLPVGNVQDGFTGLTPSVSYYASNTAGAGGATSPSTAGSVDTQIAKAISATEVILKESGKRTFVSNLNFNLNESGGALATLYITIPTGFRPEKVRLIYLKQESAGGSNDCEVFDQTYYATTAVGGLEFTELDASGVMLNAASTIGPGTRTTGSGHYIIPTTIHNNGFDLTIKQGTTSAEVIQQVYIQVEG